MSPRRILLVARASSSETAKTVQAIAALHNVELVTRDLSGIDEITEAAVKLRGQDGSLERIVTPQETLLEPVALANEALGLPGLSVGAVRRTLDKSQLKATLRAAGLNTPRYRVVSSFVEARVFATEIGFPIVLKSPSGSGALATFLINNEDDFSTMGKPI